MSSGNSDRCVEAAKLMNQAVELLPNNSTTVTPSVVNSASAQTQSTPLPQEAQEPTSAGRSASQELRDAFTPYNYDRHAYQFNRHGRGRGTGGYSSRQRRNSPFEGANTWTHKFCLVPYKDLQFTPSLGEKDSWKAAGLGEKMISFRKNGDYKSFEQTLCNAYEALSDAGGFLLLRSTSRCGAGESKRLELIPIPYGGYTARYLKYDSPLRSATCYI